MLTCQMKYFITRSPPKVQFLNIQVQSMKQKDKGMDVARKENHVATRSVVPLALHALLLRLRPSPARERTSSSKRRVPCSLAGSHGPTDCAEESGRLSEGEM